jgi:hypothetical protein
MLPAATSYTAPDGQPFAVACDARPDGTLHACVTGPKGSVELAVAYWQVLAAEAGRRGARRLLVENRSEGPPLSPQGLAEVIARLQGQGLERVRIAYVETLSEHVAAMEHGQIFAAEAGFDARVFGDTGSAERWLRYGA